MKKSIKNAGSLFYLAVQKFSKINATQWAGAFGFDAFFSLFPMLILLVSVVSFFIERNTAGIEVINYIKGYVPITGDMKKYIFETIDGVIVARKEVGVIAFLILIWSALQCFTTLISAATLAWGSTEYKWWRLILKSLMFLGISAGAVLIGIGIPVLIRLGMIQFFPQYDFRSWVYEWGIVIFPLLIVFFTISLFYRLAPKRETQFSEVWASALVVTILLWSGQNLFIFYLKNFATLNAVYGAFGGIMALLLWIYLSGCFFIFGACLCAANVVIHSPHKKE